MARREPSLKVEVPKPEDDRPEFGKVGIIAGVGFVLGVLWPWLAGVKLVPSPPADERAETRAAASAVAAPSSAAPAASVAADDAAAAPAAAVLRTDKETVKVGDVQIVGCHDEHGKKLKDCDRVAFDRVARGPLAALSACPAAENAKDTLSIGFELDLEEKRIKDVFAGKSTTFPKEKAKALVECARKEFDSVRLDGIDHEHPGYTAFYFVEFIPPGTVLAAPGADAAEETSEASGLATVQWDVAVVRDEPETGKIATRLRYGTRVVVTARRGKWYQVKYDAKGTKGWVHRNAIGL